MSDIISNSIVAPHAGAWIETLVACCCRLQRSVAPHAGAWIETPPQSGLARNKRVAPHAGAWIETLIAIYRALLVFGRAPRGRVD